MRLQVGEICRTAASDAKIRILDHALDIDLPVSRIDLSEEWVSSIICEYIDGKLFSTKFDETFMTAVFESITEHQERINTAFDPILKEMLKISRKYNADLTKVSGEEAWFSDVLTLAEDTYGVRLDNEADLIERIVRELQLIGFRDNTP